VNDDAVEIVERKGLGHPDTICDALAENLSHNLCREYRRRFGQGCASRIRLLPVSSGPALPLSGTKAMAGV
jgi:S-adenosylmethionine synthetase